MISVMIIEDEPSALDRYSNYVECYGNFLNVSARAYTSIEAWELFQKVKPDILFSDIRIPGENGLDLISRFRKTGWNGELVIISGYDDFSYAQKAIQISVTDYLLKPVFQDDFNRILDRLLEKLRRRTGEGEFPEKSNPQWPEHIVRAEQYIKIHLEQDITLTDAADYSFVSSSYLSSSFHKVLGVTFIEHIRQIRIEKAKKLLQTTRLSLKDIGEKCGLPDPSYFNRSFRKVTGISPSRYRQEVKIEHT